jgi:hypothetical protein
LHQRWITDDDDDDDDYDYYDDDDDDDCGAISVMYDWHGN